MKSVRLRLLVLALLPLVVLVPILFTFTMANWANRFDQLLISKVASDLRIAEQYMQRIVTIQGSQISSLAASTAFRDAASAGEHQLSHFLAQNQETLGLDYLVIRKLRRRHTASPENPIILRAISHGTATGIEIFSAKELGTISEELAETARVPLIKTEAALPTVRNIEGRGMVILGATYVDVAGESAVLVGGTILNRNLDFIDTINDLVYPSTDIESSKIGTATLFLEDVRISTNVRLFENVRALGTRVSEAVYRTVLSEGRTWLDRAFVVNDWYISGYLPILNSQNSRIGMLYVGFLEKPFIALKTNIYVTLITVFLVIVALSVPFFLWIARGIFYPLEQMNQTMRGVEAGNLDSRINTIKSKDEIGQVASHLNALLDQVQERDQKLRDWAATLNDKVSQRTEELRLSNEKLEQTYKQLIVREKLASIGEITAGVAHEINNPVAVIQGNIDVVQAGLGPQGAKYSTEFNLINEQVYRINSIVGKLLQFAKPNDFTDFILEFDVTQVLEDCIVLVQHPLMKWEIEIEREYNPVPLVQMNQGELQQVLVNVFMNAIQSMPKGGTLTLKTDMNRRDGRPGLAISIIDTGKGISTKNLEQIFDPFFTTKRGEGTGLGLSISQSLIQRAGGIIIAKSKIDQGSTFIIWLPESDSLS